MVWTIRGGGDTQTLLPVKKIELLALTGGGDIKTSGASACPPNEPPVGISTT